GLVRLPRAAHGRRPRAPPAREARADTERAAVHPDGARRRLPLRRLSSRGELAFIQAMPSVAAIIFPFRRLAIWLSVLVLVVATLAVVITSLLVIPSLQGNLVRARVAEIDRSAKANLPLFTTYDAESAVNIYEALTGNRAAVLKTLNGRGD